MNFLLIQKCRWLNRLRMVRYAVVGVLLSATVLLLSIAHSQAQSIDDRFFEERIRPVLVENCFECHGVTNATVGLRLDTPLGFRTDDGQGMVITPGDAASSRLIKAIKGHAEVSPMPPTKRLKEQEIRDFESWVTAGAEWPNSENRLDGSNASSHWAFQPMKRVPIPRNDDHRWSNNSIDRWILQAMHSKGLTHSEPASHYHLARRLAYDLTGLPPTMDQVEALEGFEGNPEKVTFLVDELIESQAFAEHWARHWLDVARYADTFGQLFDNDDFNPNAYTYRDWVIKAFQDDMPYDDFLRLQLNADQLTEPNSPELAALGFLTVGLKFEDSEPEIVDDRLDAIFRGLQGLSISCARCHDHKYDPISTEDYYSLYGIFSESREVTQPLFQSDSDRTAFDIYEAKLRQLQFAFDRFVDEKRQQRFGKPHQQVAQYLLATTVSEDTVDNISVEKNGRRSDGLHTTLVDRYRVAIASAKSEHSPIFAPWIAYTQFSSLTDDDISRMAREYQRWITDLEEGTEDVATGSGQARDPEKPINRSIASIFADRPPRNKEELAARYGAIFQEIGDEWRSKMEKAWQEGSAAPEQLSVEDRDEIRQLMFDDEPLLDVNQETVKNSLEEDDQTKFEELANNINEFEAGESAPRQARIIVDGGEREQYVFVRGKPDRPGPKVEPHFLRILDPEQETFLWETARGQLAQSITDPHNPLTARVWVNRVWGHLFGQGIVDTPSDFGVRGSQPTHPELLDTLALDFIKHDWSTRKLIRRIVMSAAYQQSSLDRPEMQAIDPENRFLWRMNRKRLSSESIRDSLLATSGILDASFGGRSIKDNDINNRRRTLYSEVNRRHPSSLARTFDFANAMMHSPKRYETIVPQQTLWLMNGSFSSSLLQEWDLGSTDIVEDTHPTKEKEDRNENSVDELGEADSPPDVIRSSYRRVLQREPSDEEYQLAIDFLENAGSQSVPILDEYSAWRYGTAQVQRQPIRISEFTEFESSEDDSWHQDEFRLDASGGQTGNDPQRVVVRRWILPAEGKLEIKSLLSHHYQEEKPTQSDGVAAVILWNEKTVLGKCSIDEAEQELNCHVGEAKAGDTIDFVVHARKNNEQDRFEWKVDLELKSEDSNTPLWISNSEQHFRTESRPLAKPLSGPAQLVQVLWMSNEFLYID